MSQIDADPLGLFPNLGALERTNSNDDSDADSSDSDGKGRHRWGNKEEEARKRERAERRKECCGPKPRPTVCFGVDASDMLQKAPAFCFGDMPPLPNPEGFTGPAKSAD